MWIGPIQRARFFWRCVVRNANWIGVSPRCARDVQGKNVALVARLLVMALVALLHGVPWEGRGAAAEWAVVHAVQHERVLPQLQPLAVLHLLHERLEPVVRLVGELVSPLVVLPLPRTPRRSLGGVADRLPLHVLPDLAHLGVLRDPREQRGVQLPERLPRWLLLEPVHVRVVVPLLPLVAALVPHLLGESVAVVAGQAPPVLPPPDH